MAEWGERLGVGLSFVPALWANTKCYHLQGTTFVQKQLEGKVRIRLG